MEKLEGILIATTNLVTNLDAAFERRFLFKVRFGKPSMEVNERIWRSKLEWLDVEGARQLAASYGFSGGEIDNVVRKVAMEKLVAKDNGLGLLQKIKIGRENYYLNSKLIDLFMNFSVVVNDSDVNKSITTHG